VGHSLQLRYEFELSSRNQMLPPPTVALADDDESQLELLSTWLEHHGYRVHPFESGEELIRWASDAVPPVDAFLLDVDMPGRDGIESCRCLKSIPAYARTPVVFVSSLSGDTLREAAVSVGAAGMVRKDAEMLPRLSSWLEQSLGRASATR